MNDAKVHAVSWDIEGYGKVPKGALREEVRNKTSNVVAQKLCKYALIGNHHQWLSVVSSDLIGDLFRFTCAYDGNHEVYGRIVRVINGVHYVHYEFMAQRESYPPQLAYDPWTEEGWFSKGVSAKDGKEYKTYHYDARLCGKSVREVTGWGIRASRASRGWTMAATWL